MDGEFKNNINTFLKNNAIWIAVGFVVIILITLIILFLFNRNKTKKIDKTTYSISTNDWLDSLGGKDNILEISSRGSRLTLSLKEISLINETKLKELGVTSLLKMSNKLILVIEENAAKIEEIIKK
ncbi:MAG: PTS transporter subunit EIIB [Bacilli bacterium]|nr:PTS transporter subunit EIIB [Bacilli bacterium]